MSEDDVLFGFRLRLFTLAEEIGVRAACRQMGVHHSTFYRWKAKVDRWGLEALRIRERRRPRMPNQLGPHLEGQVIAFSLGHPGFGPRRISAELGEGKVGRDPDLRARDLESAETGGTEHPRQAPGPDRPPRRPLLAETRSAAPGAV